MQLLECPAWRGRLPQRRIREARALGIRGAGARHVPSQAKTSTAYPNGVLGFFSDHGLMWREEGRGACTRWANKAASVLDCLRAACAAAGVEERVECEVAAVEPPRAEGGPFTLRLADGASSGPTRSSWPWAVQSRAGFCPRAFPSASRSRRWARWPPSRAGRAASTISACAGRWNCGARRGDAARGARPPRLSDGHPRGRALGVPRGGRGDVPQVRRLGHRRFQPEPPG